MSGCVEYRHQHVSPMTGSRELGPIQPHKIIKYYIKMPNDFSQEQLVTLSPNYQQSNQRKITSMAQTMIQLTPLWEHVVRTQQFPSEIDKQSTFDEISERLRDPEWEVRQHALRVLIDVLPTLDNAVVDDLMMSVVPELINNLGHMAPAVRKGGLDALRVYLLCSQKRDDIVNNILEAGLKRQDIHDSFQTSITAGVILSTPSLLFPSKNPSSLSKKTLKSAINGLANRLVQVTHQESALRSLVKIRDTIGNEDFNNILIECDPKFKTDFEIFCQVYEIKEAPVKRKKRKKKLKKKQNNNSMVVEEIKTKTVEGDNKSKSNSIIPPSRVVLETEIKFNSETAIMMTILEENNGESDEESGNDTDGNDDDDDEEDYPDKKLDNEEEKSKSLETEEKYEWIERRKTPRRVHFGGEIVKLRTPDSDDADNIVHQTRIPLPIAPATKMPFHKSRKSVSPTRDDNLPLGKKHRRSRSVSNSPKREFYVHDGSLSPKKSILSKTNGRGYFYDHGMNRRKSKSLEDERLFKGEVDEVFGIGEGDRSWSFEVFKDSDDEGVEPVIVDVNVSPKKEKRMKKKRKSKSAGDKKKIIEQEEKSSDLFLQDDSNETSNSKKTYLQVPQIVIEKLVDDKIVNKEEKNLKNFAKRPSTTLGLIERRNSFDIDMKIKKNEERSQSCLSRKINNDSFPKKERNYIHMELSSPIKIKLDLDEIASKNNTEVRKVSSSFIPEALSGAIVNSSSDNITNDLDKVDETLTIEREQEKHKEKNKNDNKVEKSKSLINYNSIVDDFKKQNYDIDDSGDSRNGSCDSEPKILELNWEELGLVDQEVLDDLHNKDDWRARVRALERIATVLRTPSSLIAIESRLGSLLQTVLGGERSCKVAAAGMSVARVVISGVSEEALERRLPQIAWGLTRQGGPNAAQLSRIVMLRLRPSLFFEQLLQPHCIDSRNAKTRENALQLLIFSLVTFPSTEFKVENVANKVALMVGDKRRRVRQAALDTLAVLAQIYEPEETLIAGNRAAKQLKEGSDMVAAIRARIARKSLPMVSPDGLVVYGLQISPALQMATGPDVDWIIAGTGSVSPGTARARGQLISPTSRSGFLNNNKQPTGRSSAPPKPNFVALGVGLNSEKNNKTAWQLVPSTGEEVNQLSLGNKEEYRNNSTTSIEKSRNKSRIDDKFTSFSSQSSADKLNSSVLINEKDVIMKQRKTEENFHRRLDEIYRERLQNNGRTESRIPVPQIRDREIVIRNSTAYHRRRREDDYSGISSAPQSSSGEHDAHEVEIARRYRSDRLRQSSRPGSEERARSEPQRDTLTQETPADSSYHNRRRRNIVQATLEHQDPLPSSRVDSRRNSLIHQSSNSASLSLVQRSPRSRRLSSIPLILGDKKDEEENLNEKNRRHVSAQANSYRIQNLNDQSTQCSGCDQVPFEVSNSSSNSSVENQSTRVTDIQIQNVNDENIPPRNSFSEKSFDVITGELNPSRRNSIDQITPSVISSDSVDLEKDTSSDDVQIGGENYNVEKNNKSLPDSSSSVVSNETNSTESMTRIIENSTNDNDEKSFNFDEHDSPDASLAFDRGYSNEVEVDIESQTRASISPDEERDFESVDYRLEDHDDIKKLDKKRINSAVNSRTIFVTSRPHSRATSEYHEPSFQQLDYHQQSDITENSVNVYRSSRSFEDNENTDGISVVTNQSFTELPEDSNMRGLTAGMMHRSVTLSNENGTSLEIAKTHGGSEAARRIPSRVPRMRVKPRVGINKVAPINLTHHHVDKVPARSKAATIQCFSQLESSDWEVSIKGLKTLSMIARQRPEHLDTCAPGTVGRLLGRHVRNLRSQVARIACLAAGDVFESQTRCLDQDLDDIAGPLLQRTADTNKFLRADSNAALDRMIEHLSPQKTVAVIVYRGASHQNGIVRAATARLLCSIVDRIGPDLVMMLPRDVRDKFLSSIAKLVMDGNLDARNHAKKIFKTLSRWDGFRRALKDSVPETTLRHIDKTLRSL